MNDGEVCEYGFGRKIGVVSLLDPEELYVFDGVAPGS